MDSTIPRYYLYSKSQLEQLERLDELDRLERLEELDMKDQQDGGFSIIRSFGILNQITGGGIHQYITAVSFAQAITDLDFLKQTKNDNSIESQIENILKDSSDHQTLYDLLNIKSDPKTKILRRTKTIKQKLYDVYLKNKSKIRKAIRGNFKFKETDVTFDDYRTMAVIRGIRYELLVWVMYKHFINKDVPEWIKKIKLEYNVEDKANVEDKDNFIDEGKDDKDGKDSSLYYKLGIALSCIMNGSRIPDAPSDPGKLYNPPFNYLIKDYKEEELKDNIQFSSSNLDKNLLPFKTPDQIVKDSHEGILSIWHSMNVNKDNLDLIKEKYALLKVIPKELTTIKKYIDEIYINTDDDVDAKQIITFIVRDILERINAARKINSITLLGHALHTIQDSYSQSHAKRVSQEDGKLPIITKIYDFTEQNPISHVKKDMSSYVIIKEHRQMFSLLDNYVVRRWLKQDRLKLINFCIKACTEIIKQFSALLLDESISEKVSQTPIKPTSDANLGSQESPYAERKMETE